MRVLGFLSERISCWRYDASHPAPRISSMSGAGGNQDFLFALGDRALRSVDHLQTYYSVQRRHPEGGVARTCTLRDSR